MSQSDCAVEKTLPTDNSRPNVFSVVMSALTSPNKVLIDFASWFQSSEKVATDRYLPAYRSRTLICDIVPLSNIFSVLYLDQC